MNKQQVITALQKYRFPNEISVIPDNNSFIIVTQDMIDEQELRMKSLGDRYYPFPDDLKEFWIKVGYGDLIFSQDGTIKSEYFLNYLLSPQEIADIMLEESYHNNMDWDVFPGVFPCFNTSESDMYSMIMDGQIISGTENYKECDLLISKDIWEFYNNSLQNPEWYLGLERGQVQNTI